VKDRPLYMSREQRAQLDRDRKAYRLALDARMNGTASTDKAEKHERRERQLGRMSTGFDWQQALKLYGYRCAFCGVDERDADLTVDHIIPLSRGGGNWQWNIRPLCEPCNTTKGSQLDIEFPLGREI